MSALDLRSPPCRHCGLVEPVRGPRHTCNPTHVQTVQIGAGAVERMGRSLRDAFAVFCSTRSLNRRMVCS